MISTLLHEVINGNNLSRNDANYVMDQLMKGFVSPAQIGSLATALRMKGESVDEITGFAEAMRLHLSPVKSQKLRIVDTCGTGGDSMGTFNISTAAAIVAASGGVAVAKHGNRAVSSRSGSADVLEALGVNVELSPTQAALCLDELNLCFMFAPLYHQAMKYAAVPRKELGFRTIFNLLGPLTNPANANRQVVGVYSPRLVEPIAHVLNHLGCERALVVAGDDGLDELTVTTTTQVAELKDGVVTTYTFSPLALGLPYRKMNDLIGGSAEDNAVIIRDILSGEKGAPRDIVLLNAAATFYVAEHVNNLRQGIELAIQLIDEGSALHKLEQLSEMTGDMRHAS